MIFSRFFIIAERVKLEARGKYCMIFIIGKGRILVQGRFHDKYRRYNDILSLVIKSKHAFKVLDSHMKAT